MSSTRPNWPCLPVDNDSQRHLSSAQWTADCRAWTRVTLRSPSARVPAMFVLLTRPRDDPLTPLNPLPLSLLPPPSVTTDHPCLPTPTGYSQKQIRNPDILNPLNSANHLPGGACNNTDGAGLCTSICNQNCQPGWAATGMPRQTCVCFLLISEDWALRGMPPPLRVSTGNDIKIGGWQLCVGVVRGQDLWLSDRQVRSYADLNKEQEDRVSDSYCLLRSLCSRTGATSCLSQITDCLDASVHPQIRETK